MDTKKFALHHGMKLMSNPRVMTFMQDERVMKALMVAMSIPGRLTSAAQQHADRVAHLMALATEQEVRDLRRTVRSLEDQIAEIKHNLGNTGSRHSNCP